MAKRKRLNPALLTGADPERLQAPETKSASSVPPIADMAGVAAATAAARELADELVEARRQGRMVLEIPLDAIDAGYLVRERLGSDPEAENALYESLRTRGQQTPIEVTETAPNRYGLISGWRRLQALRKLHAETGAGRFGQVLALLRQPEDAADAYLAMIEENEIRAGLSYYERARIAARAVEQGVYDSEKQALLALYRSASRPRRSKIRSFLTIYHALDGELKFARSIGERLGLALSAHLAQNADLAETLRKALREAAPASDEEEQKILKAALRPAAPPLPKPMPEPGGYHVRRGPDGSAIIRGPRIDAAFLSELAAWLSSRH